MPTLKSFLDAAKAVVSLGSSTNAASRQEIRDVVGLLADELDRALSLADSYLAGARYSRNDQDLITYLQGGRGKIVDGFLEYHVCAGLYSLADKFEQVFDATKFSVDIGNYHQIPELIRHLKSGERAVMDDLDGIFVDLDDLAFKLASPQLSDPSTAKSNITKAIEYHRSKLDSHRTKIRSLRRRIIDSM